MTLPVYYSYPFAVSGDREAIPTLASSASPSYGMSYQNGYTSAYAIQLGDPDSLPINREQMNGLFYDLCSNVQNYQQQGTAPWHPASDNNGVSIEYPLYARVLYAGLIYESQAATNTDTPGTGTSWRVVSGSTVMPGTIIDYAGATVPDGYLNCNGATVSSTTYAALYAAIGVLWGNTGGAGTFDLPDLRSYTTVGSGITLSPLSASTVGTRGGSATTDQVVNHTHTVTITSSTTTLTGSAGSSVLQSSQPGTPLAGAITTANPSGGVSAQTIVQPSAVVMKLIKY